VGVSLCEAEASVAAPMTSRNQTIASMITVVAEGRCTLMATYQIFQFIIGYALVQSFSTNIMYTYALNIGNYQVGPGACTRRCAAWPAAAAPATGAVPGARWCARD
jgi:magnesium-transporting ATPase (P-type)